MSPEEQVLQNLRLLCDYMDINSIEHSSPIISKYALLLIHDPTLKPVIEDLWKDLSEDYSTINPLLKKLSKKISPICKSVVIYAKKYCVDKPNIINELLWFKGQEGINTNVYLKLIALKRIFYMMFHDTLMDHRAFIKKYATIDESDTHGPIIFSRDINNLEAQIIDQLHYLNRITQTREWYYLKQIIDFFIIYDPKVYEEQREIALKQHPINEFTLRVRSDALKRAIGPTKDPYSPEQGYNPREYKKYMDLLNAYAQKKLTPPIPSSLKIKASDWNYSTETRKFKCLNKIANFSEFKLIEGEKRTAYGYPGEVLAKVTANGKSKRTIWLFINLHEAIVGTNPEKDSNKVIYDTCVHINQRLLDDCDLKDFLIFDTTSVRINPTYLD
jgi:hypothetical protein